MFWLNISVSAGCRTGDPGISQCVSAASAVTVIVTPTSVARQPLIREHTAYFTTIEKVHDLGNQYDTLLRGRGETPSRRRSSVTPAKRASVSHGRRSVASPLSSGREQDGTLDSVRSQLQLLGRVWKYPGSFGISVVGVRI